MKYYVSGRTMHYDEIEEEFDDLVSAQTFAGRIIDDGGYAEVFDETGKEYPAYPW